MIDHGIVEFQEGEMDLRHQQVLVVTVIAYQRHALDVARQIVG